MAVNYTTHQGRVIEKSDKSITVEITLNDACQHCSSKSGCMILNSNSRTINVPIGKNDSTFEIGEEVDVIITTNSGLKAVFYAYLLPTLLLIGSVSCAYALHVKEGIIALTALFAIVLYYLLLYIFRHRINRKFSFSLEKK